MIPFSSDVKITSHKSPLLVGGDFPCLSLKKMSSNFGYQVTCNIFTLMYVSILQFAYTIVYNVVVYYTLFVYTETTMFQAFFTIALCLGIQFLAHLVFEGETPQRLPTKEDNMLFQVLDLANEFFLAPFHFSLTLMVRCDLLPILRWRSDAALHKLMTSTQELKYGKKSP